MQCSISARTARIGTAAALALALLPGCGLAGGSTGGPDPSEVSGSITWWDTSNETEAPFFNQLVAAFQREHPRIDVTYVNVPFFEAEQRYREAAASGGAPDVLRADVGWTAGLVDAGLLADLTGTPAEPAPEEFLEQTVAGVTFEDGVYGVPQVTDTLALMYNRDLFEEAGLGRPPRDWTELRDYALTVKEATGAEGIVLNTDAYFALPFLYGEGTDLIDPVRRAITVADEDAVRGIATAAALVESGAAPVPPETGAYDSMVSAFRAGEAAMMINGPWVVADLLDSSTFARESDLGIAPVPAGSQGVAGGPTGGHSMVVSAHSAHPGAAQLFVRFMTAAEQQRRAATTLGLLPTRKAAYTDDVLADPVRNAFYFAQVKAVPRTAPAQGAAMLSTLQERYTAVLRGEREPAEALAETAQVWRDELLLGYSIDPVS